MAQFQVLLRWGWLAGIALLVGVTFNLLRLAVGWWELRRFRRRSIRIDSPALEESLDIVRAALSVRLPVELRQTAEMTSPATIGWLRPVVILPVDWEEWSEEERLGVLAHELAHISRHDFITGLFSQLVLSLHFYHPLITWLVHRLHLEQELAADAAAVRVLGGHKPYLRMLAGMALKDHVAVLPGAARTFFPQPGMLMARVELLRGNKLEAGEGSFSWRAAVRGVLVCVGLVLAGLRPLAGSD
ncbi:MAG: M56 family metallopeptidase, partial [Planctomycetaceae bacterium]